jgi:RNA polymerase sigma factor (sigma-70 family)
VDAEQLGCLIDTYAAPLELYARQWCEDPADVVQSAFVRMIEQEQQPERPGAWLYRVVRNLAISRRRSTRRRQNHERSAVATLPDWFEPESGSGLDGEAATRALSELPVELREVVLSHLWGGLTFEEIGDLTATSSSTAHRRYSEGIRLLRKLLGVSCPTTN